MLLPHVFHLDREREVIAWFEEGGGGAQLFPASASDSTVCKTYAACQTQSISTHPSTYPPPPIATPIPTPFSVYLPTNTLISTITTLALRSARSLLNF